MTLTEVEANGRRLRTVAQVAERLGVHKATVYNLMREGQLRGYKVGRSRRILEEDVDRLLGLEPQAEEDDPADRPRHPGPGRPRRGTTPTARSLDVPARLRSLADEIEREDRG